jgi:5-methylcytosine-specific restriction enzyme A
MTYRHRVYIETGPYERLAALGAEAITQIQRLPYTPRTHYFREDPSGRFARPVRVAGFVDHLCHASQFDIFVRGGLGLSETVATIFHEGCHIGQFHRGELTTVSHEARKTLRPLGWIPPDQRRPPPNKRGYDSAWRQLRKRILARDPICVICRTVPSDTVDHILSMSKGGTNDDSNLRGTCHPCHSRKTATHDDRWDGRR